MSSKLLLSSTLFSILLLSCGGETKTSTTDSSAKDTTVVASPASGPDTTLIRETGADDYGMKHYVMAFLKAGPKRDQDSATRATIQAGHMANIDRLAKEGKLVMAGPFEDDSEFAGIFIFDATMEEAKTMTEADPAVQSGRLIMELHPWYGSAALVKMNALHDKLQTKTF